MAGQLRYHRKVSGGARARRLALAFAVSSFAHGAAAAAAAPVTVDGGVEGEVRTLELTWPGGAAGQASQDKSRVILRLDRPQEVDMAAVADRLSGAARIVQQSADGKEITLNLQSGFQAYAAEADGKLVLTVLPDGAAAPAGAQKLSQGSLSFGQPDSAPAEHEDHATPPAPDTHEAQDTHDAQAAQAEAPPPTPNLVAPELTVGEFDGHTRLVFRHPKPVPYEAVLEEGQLTLEFASPQEIRLTQLKVQPPPMVRSADGHVEGQSFIAQLALISGTGVRHYQEGTDTVIDLIPPAAETAHDEEGHGATDHAAAGQEDDTHAADAHAADAHAADAHDAETHGAEVHDDSANHAAADEPAHDPLFDDGHAVTSLGFGEEGHGPDSGQSAQPLGHAEAAALGSDAVPIHGVVPAVVKFSQTGIGIQFRFGEPVPAAVTRRGERLWIAFAGHGEFDLSALGGLNGEGVRSVEQYAAPNAMLVGLTLAPHLLVTAIPDEIGWKLNLGDSILTPTPSVAVQRLPGEDGGRVVIDLQSEGAVARFTDPDVGDELVFVMAKDPVQGLISAREYADFNLMATAQGLVVNPKTDGVEVHVGGKTVTITRDRGLNLSGPEVAALVHAELPDAAGHSPARLNFTEWQGDPAKPYGVKYEALMTKIATAHEAVRSSAEMDLAKFLLAYGLYEEARGLMSVVASDMDNADADATLRTMRAVANLMTGRTKEAAADLDSKAVPDDSHGKLWKAMLAAAESRWPDARLLFEDAEWAIPLYDDEWQTRFRLAAVRAGLAVNDLSMATQQMEVMPVSTKDKPLRAEILMLRGRLAEALEQYDKARGIYEELAQSTVEPIAAEAELHRLTLALKRNSIDVADAVDQLEALRFRWRGDTTEMETLIALGELYTKLGDYRHGLNTLRIAVRSFPGTPQQRRASEKMSRIFEDLYLHGLADELPPIQALGLYYDFKELTPVGANGDLMIRRLADRLVDMDLLDQAIELLKHQVDNRLRGVARSQVAIRLAMIELMNHKPEAALRTIQTTRQARLPDSVAMQRRLLESRALLEVGRHDHALDVLEADKGPAFERMRADIYWDADRWPEAAKTLTAILGDSWQSPEPLDDQARFDVMRTAIAFTLSGDETGLETLRRRYGAKMAETPDARAFDIIAHEDVGRSVEFRTLVERIASVNTLEAFMSELKAQGAGVPDGIMN